MEDNSEPVSHGTSVFNVHRGCNCRLCKLRRLSVLEFAGWFSAVRTKYFAEAAEESSVFIEYPICGEVYLTSDESLDSQIRELLTDVDCKSDDMAKLAKSGWQAVGNTGMLAFDLDGELALSVHGYGYDFFDTHWEPLYEALGYQ